MLIFAGCGLLAAVLLGLLRQEPLAPDSAARELLTGWLNSQHDLLRLMVLPSEPVVLIPVVAVIAAVCALQRRWPDAVLAVVAPLLTVGVNSWALKPLFGLLSDGALAYPSGHTASLVAVCTVLVLLARPGSARWLAAAVGVTVTIAAGVGMVVLGYHHAGDIAGGALVGAGVVLACAISLGRRLRRGPGPSGG